VEASGCVFKGNLFLVLEYVEHDLSGLLDKSYKFGPALVKSIMCQLLGALQFMHGEGFVHRDIKSSNLLITNHHVVKLADFGLARDMRSDSTGDKHPAGENGAPEFTNKVITLWYRPPELLLGTKQYGSAVDMWSAGCILAELLLGRPLMPGRSEEKQIAKIFEMVGSPTPELWPNREYENMVHWDKFRPEVPMMGRLEKELCKVRSQPASQPAS